MIISYRFVFSMRLQSAPLVLLILYTNSFKVLSVTNFFLPTKKAILL